MNFATETEQEAFLTWADARGWDPEDPETLLFWEARQEAIAEERAEAQAEARADAR